MENRVRAVLLYILSLGLLSTLFALSKLLMEQFNLFQVIFFRNIMALLCIAPLLIWQAPARPWRSKRIRAHLRRGFWGFVNITLIYMAIKHLPLALALTFRQLEAFSWMLFGHYWYGERAKPHQWLALMLGGVGVLVLLQPALAINTIGLVASLAAALTGGLIRAWSRDLSKTERSTTIMTMNFAQWSILSAMILPWVWQDPVWGDWIPLMGAGLLLIAAQWTMTEAVGSAPASFLAPWRYSELVFAALWGYAIWHEQPSPVTTLGAFIIVVAGLLASWPMAQKPNKKGDEP